MQLGNEEIYKVPRAKNELVLRALSNSARYNILQQLSQGPMNISELARAINISQPTVTTYVNQLEKAGLIFCRLQKSSKGYNKICHTTYRGVSLFWETDSAETIEDEYNIDLPVGHYSSIDCVAPSFLATQAGIIASSEDFSRFFHPIRMQAELLLMTEGNVHYLFPYNIPDTHKILYLEVSAEICVALDRADCCADVSLTINNHRFAVHRMTTAVNKKSSNHLLEWYPKDLATTGQLYVWRVEADRSTLNDIPAGNMTLADLNLQPMQPIEISFEVKSPGKPPGGMIIFGKSFGQYNQDIRLTVVHEREAHRDEDRTR